MPLPALIVPILMSVAAAEDAPITVRGYPWAPFISPMGEPVRPPSTGEAPIARWFALADRNQDGVLTADEMLADADRFFARLDENQDGRIDPQEITASTQYRVGGRNLPLLPEVSFVAIKNGMHQEEGFAFFTPGVASKAPTNGAHVASLGKTVSDYFERTDSFKESRISI